MCHFDASNAALRFHDERGVLASFSWANENRFCVEKFQQRSRFCERVLVGGFPRQNLIWTLKMMVETIGISFCRGPPFSGAM